MELEKSFEPKHIESRWYPEWEKSGYFKAGLDPHKTTSFCILLPPPNVTGTLHMGHGFNQTLMDALTRYHRMKGDNTLWQPGTDHAGIATQIVVERQLDAQGISRHDLGRENSSRKCGSGRNIPATPSPSRCAASAPRPTGRANASRWTKGCPIRSPRPLCACTTKV